MNRARTWQRALALLAVSIAPAWGSDRDGSDQASWSKKTYAYKQAGACTIEADVYRPDDGQVRPIVVWIHGGALILGNRRSVPGRLRELCRDEGFVLISLDYRLAPEVKLPEIIQDLKDAFRWIGQNGLTLLKADPGRMVVTGGSAGGYLTMMAGICAEPRPKALVAYWGYGSIVEPWCRQPSQDHGDAASLPPQDEMLAAVSGRPISGIDQTSPTWAARVSYYRYLRQQGQWAGALAGFDPQSDREKLLPYCPVYNLTSTYPPILMIHGTADTDVPYEASAAMARKLTECGVPHELITIPHAGHGLKDGDPAQVGAAHARALAFIRKHLGELHEREERYHERPAMTDQARKTVCGPLVIPPRALTTESTN